MLFTMIFFKGQTFFRQQFKIYINGNNGKHNGYLHERLVFFVG